MAIPSLILVYSFNFLNLKWFILSVYWSNDGVADFWTSVVCMDVYQLELTQTDNVRLGYFDCPCPWALFISMTAFQLRSWKDWPGFWPRIMCTALWRGPWESLPSVTVPPAAPHRHTSVSLLSSKLYAYDGLSIWGEVSLNLSKKQMLKKVGHSS